MHLMAQQVEMRVVQEVEMYLHTVCAAIWAIATSPLNEAVHKGLPSHGPSSFTRLLNNLRDVHHCILQHKVGAGVKGNTDR